MEELNKPVAPAAPKGAPTKAPAQHGKTVDLVNTRKDTFRTTKGILYPNGGRIAGVPAVEAARMIKGYPGIIDATTYQPPKKASAEIAALKAENEALKKRIAEADAELAKLKK